jgi:hypothetical protein
MIPNQTADPIKGIDIIRFKGEIEVLTIGISTNIILK